MKLFPESNLRNPSSHFFLQHGEIKWKDPEIHP